MRLDDARYCNLATFRRSGVAVETPVWFARDETAGSPVYYVFSAGDAGKVKRIRADGRARVAPCDVRGRLLGEWQEAKARLVTEEAEIARGYRALRARYGWQMRVGDVFATLTGRYHRRALIAFTAATG
jgi:PPOX class probable F420-dependent enzyme